MKKQLSFLNSALIVVDMQYEESPQGSLPVHSWEEVVKNAERVLTVCREKSIPIVYTRTTRRPDGIDSHSFDSRQKDGTPSYSVEGSREAQIVEELQPKRNDIVVNKQRWSAFFQTNMEIMLQGLGVKHLIMIGVFTDSCFLTTVYDAFFRGYRISIIKDACGAGTDTAHKTSILDMANWVYGCSIFKADEMIKALKGERYRAWSWEKPNSVPYTLDNIDDLYKKLG